MPIASYKYYLLIIKDKALLTLLLPIVFALNIYLLYLLFYFTSLD